MGSASAGVGSPSSRHRSMKCSCAAERSFSSEACHFAMNSWGVKVRFSVCREALPAAHSTSTPSGRHVKWSPSTRTSEPLSGSRTLLNACDECTSTRGAVRAIPSQRKRPARRLSRRSRCQRRMIGLLTRLAHASVFVFKSGRAVLNRISAAPERRRANRDCAREKRAPHRQLFGTIRAMPVLYVRALAELREVLGLASVTKDGRDSHPRRPRCQPSVRN